LPRPPSGTTSTRPAGTGLADGAALVAGLPPAQRAAPVQPEAVQPQEVRAPRKAVNRSAPTRTLQPGDLICGDCGEGNPPNRRFCSRCGASLVAAETVHIPWWRRIFRRRPRRQLTAAEAAAGTARRPKRSLLARAMPLIRRVVAIALLVGGIAYASFAPLRGWVNDRAVDTKARAMSVIHPQYTPIHPFEVTGQSSLSGHPPAALSDGFTNTFWAAADGDKAVVTLRFDHPVNVSRALIRSGISGNFQGANRPHDLHLVYSTGKTQDIALDDTPDAQQVTLKTGGNVTSIELHVGSLYKASSDSVAITEIELFAKK
jgi:hypothetical protein